MKVKFNYKVTSNRIISCEARSQVILFSIEGENSYGSIELRGACKFGATSAASTIVFEPATKSINLIDKAGNTLEFDLSDYKLHTLYTIKSGETKLHNLPEGTPYLELLLHPFAGSVYKSVYTKPSKGLTQLLFDSIQYQTQFAPIPVKHDSKGQLYFYYLDMAFGLEEKEK